MNATAAAAIVGVDLAKNVFQLAVADRQLARRRTCSA